MERKNCATFRVGLDWGHSSRVDYLGQFERLIPSRAETGRFALANGDGFGPERAASP